MWGNLYLYFGNLFLKKQHEVFNIEQEKEILTDHFTTNETICISKFAQLSQFHLILSF